MIHELVNQRLKMTGIILAGGKSSRMAKNKAFLELSGRPLIEKSMDVITQLFEEVLISSNDIELYQKYNIKVIPDVYQGKGPLGGLHASLQAAKYKSCFFVACDMPFIDPNVIRFMAQWGSDYQVIVPKLEAGLEPLHAFYRKDLVPIIEDSLRKDELKIIKFYQQVKVKYVLPEELCHFDNSENSFINANTPEDWEQILKFKPHA